MSVSGYQHVLSNCGDNFIWPKYPGKSFCDGNLFNLKQPGHAPMTVTADSVYSCTRTNIYVSQYGILEVLFVS